MRILTLVLVLGLALLTGCSRKYVITMNNGLRVTTKGKPKQVGNAYVFKDASGQQASVPVVRVREIAPASMASSDYTKPPTKTGPK